MNNQMSGFYDYFLSLLKTMFLLKGESFKGKLDLQKSFYLVKELGVQVPFNFRWGKIGPYSYELSNVMNRTTARGFTPYDGAYDYNPNKFRHVKELDVSDTVSAFFSDLENIVEDNGYNELYFIETVASLHFLSKYSGIREKISTFRKMRELKESRMSLLGPLLEPAWDFLLKHKLVEEETPRLVSH